MGGGKKLQTVLEYDKLARLSTHVYNTSPQFPLSEYSFSVILMIFDVCVAVHLWYGSINSQLDATITIY